MTDEYASAEILVVELRAEYHIQAQCHSPMSDDREANIFIVDNITSVESINSCTETLLGILEVA